MPRVTSGETSLSSSCSSHEFRSTYTYLSNKKNQKLWPLPAESAQNVSSFRPHWHAHDYLCVGAGCPWQRIHLKRSGMNGTMDMYSGNGKRMLFFGVFAQADIYKKWGGLAMEFENFNGKRAAARPDELELGWCEGERIRKRWEVCTNML